MKDVINMFKLSSATYINHSQRLIPDGIHHHEGMREEKPIFPF